MVTANEEMRREFDSLQVSYENLQDDNNTLQKEVGFTICTNTAGKGATYIVG